MVNQEINKAIEALKKGSIIVYPTDTLYGFGADVYNDKAVAKVFKIKKRPFNEPLLVAVADFKEIEKIAYTNDIIKVLAKKFLPGKLTLILKKKKVISDLITAGTDKVGIRIPDNKIALEILKRFGPITSTSVNIHGKKTPENIKDISMQFKENDIAVYLEGGKLKGDASTIIDVTEKEIKIIREGPISKKQIMDVVKNGY